MLSLGKRNEVNYIYVNTLRAAFYGIMAKFFLKKKLICHVRDNLNSRILKNILIRNSDAIITISKHIYNQFPEGLKKNHLIFGGIDTEFWKKEEKIYAEVKEYTDSILTFNASAILIACIGQITRWKNQIDFIRLAKIISDKYHNIHFLIVGDDLSGKEKKYKNELLNLVKDLKLQNRVQFLGHREDIKDIINNVDLLLHSAIGEPFGRVLIEAMALEKSVVAYDCGGPAEIIVNGETGYLVEPYNYKELTKKTIELIENEDLRIEMGKVGRQRVIKKFNIERYVREIEEVFDSI